MKIYLVGGAIRDRLLGFPKHGADDHVVVGATEEEFLARFPGAERVGRAFPVYLAGGAEYAFARRERKTGPGHCGFETVADPSVTLVEDLKRRDLTINAIAQDLETRELIDPWGGRKDIEQKRLRHISDAFSEDPLRLYRVARFAALLPDFTLEEATLGLMKGLVPELGALSPERVWLECERALAARAPWRFFTILRDTGALPVHFPELHALVGMMPGPDRYHEGESDTFDHAMQLLRRLPSPDPRLRFAALCHDLGKGLTDPAILPHHYGHDEAGVALVTALADRLKVSNDFRLAGELAARHHMAAAKLPVMRAGKAVTLLKKLRRFPGGGIAGYLALLHADSAGKEPDLTPLAPEFERILDIPLPEKYHDLGPKSGEILLNLQAEAFNELREKAMGT
ncbi:MAG TPA: HD domain-containing protein [bacterium]|nr:HD domain-containing protein [bacterium]